MSACLSGVGYLSFSAILAKSTPETPLSVTVTRWKMLPNLTIYTIWMAPPGQAQDDGVFVT